MSIREHNIKEFNCTYDAYTRGWYMHTNVRETITPPQTPIRYSGYKDMKSPVSGNIKTKYDVINADTFNAAHDLVASGLKPLVLNMASASRPGGGVRTGANAQEETLCRRSNLLATLELFSHQEVKDNFGNIKKYYDTPLSNTDAILSNGVTVFRDDKMIFCDPFIVDVITIPCVNHPALTKSGEINPIDRKLIKEKIIMILRTAYHNGNDSLVLGAFGCGVFACPPKEVASIFREVLEMECFQGVFKNVTFAILDTNTTTSKEGNFKPFRNQIIKNMFLIDNVHLINVKNLDNISFKQNKN